MNFLHFPRDLNCRPLSLSDLGSDNRSIQAIYAFAKTIDNPDIQKDLYSCLQLACDALCAKCDSLNLDPDVLDYWDGRSEIIVTPFDPRGVKAKQQATLPAALLYSGANTLKI